MTSQRRLFIGLWPDAELRRQLQHCQHSLLQQEPALNTARRIPAQNLHLTLHFLGNVEVTRIPALVAALQALPVSGFGFTLQSLGYFARPRILWLGLEQASPELQALVEAVRDAVYQVLGQLPGGKEKFMAHVSLFKSAAAIPQSRLRQAIAWQVHGFTLLESFNDEAGVHYRPLHGFSQGSN